MRVFKRLSLAVQAAGDGPYVRVQIGGEKIYIVPDVGEKLETMDGIELLAAKAPNGNREVAGNVSFGHLDRLGNANGAAGDRYVQRPGNYAFPMSRRRGLLHRFINPADAEKFEADKAADKQKEDA